MRKLVLLPALGLLGFLVPSAPALAVLGPDAAACSPGSNRPALLVSVNGFKNRGGYVRVQLYGDNPQEFLAKNKRLRRIELPVTKGGSMDVCVAVPKAGTYAVFVRHDADGNKKAGWSDGGGFSNNPKLSLMKLKPSLRATSVQVGSGVKPIRVVLNYRNGLSVGPVAN
jgi:uncharacterized protein (DUF2141 family)